MSATHIYPRDQMQTVKKTRVEADSLNEVEPAADLIVWGAAARCPNKVADAEHVRITRPILPRRDGGNRPEAGADHMHVIDYVAGSSVKSHHEVARGAENFEEPSALAADNRKFHALSGSRSGES
jgi:hypothetical protein